MESEPSEEAQHDIVAHPGPKRQEESGNGLNTNNDTGKINIINKQGASQEEGLLRGGGMSKVRDLQKRVTWNPPENPGPQDGVKRQQTGSGGLVLCWNSNIRANK